MCSPYRNEYRNFKLARATMRSGLGRSEEDWKRRINWSCSTHMHGNNTRKLLCSYLYLKLAKRHVSHFIFYVFSSTKSENRRAEQILRGHGLAPVGGGSGGW
jgi:hypothetical protein